MWLNQILGRAFGRMNGGQGSPAPHKRERARLFQPGAPRCPHGGQTAGWARARPLAGTPHVAAPRPAFPQRSGQARARGPGTRPVQEAAALLLRAHGPTRPRRAPQPERAPRRLTWRCRRRLDGRRQGRARVHAGRRAQARPRLRARGPGRRVTWAARPNGNSPYAAAARARPGGPARTGRGVAMGAGRGLTSGPGPRRPPEAGTARPPGAVRARLTPSDWREVRCTGAEEGSRGQEFYKTYRCPHLQVSARIHGAEPQMCGPGCRKDGAWIAVTQRQHCGLLYRAPGSGLLEVVLRATGTSRPQGRAHTPRSLVEVRPHAPPFPCATWGVPLQPPGLVRRSPSGSALPRELVARPVVACGGEPGQRGTREAGTETSLQSPPHQSMDAPAAAQPLLPAWKLALVPAALPEEDALQPPTLSSHSDPGRQE